MEWIGINIPTLVSSSPVCFILQDNPPGTIRGEPSSLGWDNLYHRSWISLKHGDKETYQCSQQPISSNESLVQTQCSCHHSFGAQGIFEGIYMSCQTNMTWLAQLTWYFQDQKGREKTSNVRLDNGKFQLGEACAGQRPKDHRNPLSDRMDPTSMAEPSIRAFRSAWRQRSWAALQDLYGIITFCKHPQSNFLPWKSNASERRCTVN